MEGCMPTNTYYPKKSALLKTLEIIDLAVIILPIRDHVVITFIQDSAKYCSYYFYNHVGNHQSETEYYNQEKRSDAFNNKKK
jgi:hypothetical protein